MKDPCLQGVLRVCGRWLSDPKKISKLARTKLVYHRCLF